ncbi:MAG: aminotransferase class I/II-fold pyridoxal phosphate-dependent enzyme [Candidatus Aenigmatarchaeota archaeon]
MLYEIAEKVREMENKGKKIIKFNVGDPDQKTDEKIIQAAFEAMKKGRTKYGSAYGEKNLREKIAEEYHVKPENVIISPGSKWLIFTIMNVVARRGNVIIISPHWTAYELIAKEIDAEPRFLHTDLNSNWKIDLNKLEEMIDSNTKLIILNSPNNPTSKVIDEKTFAEIVELAEKKNIKILSDEAYLELSFKKAKSILDFSLNHIMVNTFSKTFAMSGWRLGFAILEKQLIEKIVKLNQLTITNVPIFIQDAGVKALEEKDKIVKTMKAIYKKRCEIVCKALSKTKLKFSRPDAPFYVFPFCGQDSEKIALELLEKGVAITPGTAFGNYRNYFRIAYTVPENEILEGMEKIAKTFS